MNETQIGRMLDLLMSIDSRLKDMNEMLEGLTDPSRVWDEEKKAHIDNPRYRTLNVEVVNEVEVTGSVTAYEPR